MSDKKHALVCFPHGLGDIIQATPAMRTLWEQGYILDMMVRPSVISSHLLDDCPYIGKLIKVRTDTTEEGWQTYHLPMFKKLKQDYDKAITCTLLNVYKHRQHQMAKEFGVKPESFDLQVWINQQSVIEAQEFVHQQIGNKPFVYVHTRTEIHRKYWWDSLPYVRKTFPDMPIIDTGYQGNAYDIFPNINTAFAVMRLASHRVLSLSVMAAAADALQVRIDVLNSVDKNHHCLPLNKRLVGRYRIRGKL